MYDYLNSIKEQYVALKDLLKNCLYLHNFNACSIRATTGGKTSKTWVLPGFCEIEHSGGSARAPTMWRSCLSKNLLWWP